MDNNTTFTPIEEEPLNLEIDEDLQNGRSPTCQPQPEQDDGQFDSRILFRRDCSERELHRVDFSAWVQ